MMLDHHSIRYMLSKWGNKLISILIQLFYKKAKSYTEVTNDMFEQNVISNRSSWSSGHFQTCGGSDWSTKMCNSTFMSLHEINSEVNIFLSLYQDMSLVNTVMGFETKA